MLRRLTGRLLEGAAAAGDRAARNAGEAGLARRAPSRLTLSPAARVAFLERLAHEYDCDPQTFHEEPPRIEPVSRSGRDDRGRTVLDLAWPSTVRP